MKPYKLLMLLCFLMLANLAFAGKNNIPVKKDSTGLPGDNFSLPGAIEIFKKSKSLDEFERKLNTKDNYVNNLDLDGNGKIDYIKVIDKTNKKVHAIVLRDVISNKESQDVAVIEIEKTGDKSAILQIVGDEELFGDSTIVEPLDINESKTMNKGPFAGMVEFKEVIVNVWMWPCVEYIYAPDYVVWESPYYYNYYPGWWIPWEPMPYYTYYGYCEPYDYGCHPVYIYRVYGAHNYYAPYRNTSVIVVNRYKPAHEKYKNIQPYKTYNKNIAKTPSNNNQPKKYKDNNKQNNNNPPKTNSNNKYNKSGKPKTVNNNNNNNVNKNNSSKTDNNKNNLNKSNPPKTNNSYKNNNMNKNNLPKSNNSNNNKSKNNPPKTNNSNNNKSKNNPPKNK